MGSYEQVKKFMKRHPGTIAFRLREHCNILDKHLNPDETIKYVFAGQKNNSSDASPFSGTEWRAVQTPLPRRPL